MMLLAQILSFLSNPLIISLSAPFLIVNRTSGDPIYSAKWAILSFIFIASIATFVFYGVWKGYFSDFDISKREERKPLFIFLSIMTVLYVLTIALFNGPAALVVAVIGFSIGIGLVAVVNSFVKASIHVATLTTFVLSIAMLYGAHFLYAIILIPIIAWARVKTGRHTILEVLVGGTIGSLLTLFTFVLARLILYK